MRILKPPAVYINESVLKDQQSKERLDRMMGRIETPKVETVNDEQMDELIKQNGWNRSRRITGTRRQGDPTIVFDTYRWPPEEWPKGKPLPRKFRNTMIRVWNHRLRENIVQKDGVVCQSGYGIHSAKGCLFKCDYCGFEDILVLATNIEEFLERMDPIIRNVDGPTLWKWDNGSDTLCFEPEMGAAKLLVEYFAQFEDKFLMTYSKSDNVDHLLNLDHRGQTICCWTLNAYTQSRLIERDSATMEERIEAAYKCEQAGYNVRFRFSAVCPVHNWHQEYRDMLDLLFSKVHPDVITLETLSRFPDPTIFERVMDSSLFEPEFVKAIREGAEEMKGKIWGPIPDEYREKIYRFLIDEIKKRSPKTPISLCQEPSSMWDRLSDVLEMPPDYYACCCAKDSVPGGHPRISRVRAR